MSGKLNYPQAIEPCSPGAARTIFDGPGSHIDCDPAAVKLLSDRVLIKDIPQDDSTRGSLVIPEVAQRDGVGKGGLFRIGVVIATGPGDRFSEHGLDVDGVLRRRLLTKACGDCRGTGVRTIRAVRLADIECQCDHGRVPVVIPPQCKPGDVVVYDRRRSEELILNGERFQLSHAEQSVLAVLEEE